MRTTTVVQLAEQLHLQFTRIFDTTQKPSSKSSMAHFTSRVF